MPRVAAGGKRFRLLTVVLATLGLTAVGGGTAFASGLSSRQVYALAGAERHGTSVQGTFVGGALGPPPSGMLWTAVVRHTPLSSSGRSPAVITGGGVTLRLWSGHRLSTLIATFTGGTVAYVAERSSPSACGAQVFRVDATLSTPTASGTDGGALDVYLTHHRHSIFGRCVIYAATVRGSLTLG